MLTLNLGQLIKILYAEYLDIYKDADLAAMATASMINQLLETEEVAEEEKTSKQSS